MKTTKFTILFFLFSIFLINTVFASQITTFVSPDNSFQTLEKFLFDTENLKIATYTFKSPQIMKLIKGKDVTIIVDKSPVGGFPDIQEKILCELQKNDASIFLYDGDLRFHHAKYMIKDDESILVTTENFGEDGFPKNKNHGSRGWGVIVKDERISREFMKIFETDLGGSIPFVCSLDDYSINYGEESGDYKPVFESKTFDIDTNDIRTIFAPDAVSPLVDLIKTAEDEIYTEQFYIYRYFDKKTKEENPLLQTLINRTREGVSVKVLLDSNWYHVKDDDVNSNLNTMIYINELARDEDLTLEAKLIDLSSLGLEGLHAKGMVVDDKVLVSSINWNKNSPTRNREVGIIISNREVSDYFKIIFEHDWGLKKDKHFDSWILLLLGIPVAILILFYLKKFK